jgi:hypothetical protein
MSDSDAAFRGDNRDEDQKFQKILSHLLKRFLKQFDIHS